MCAHPQGNYERGVADCDGALQVCQESHRAMYRKALCLKELGKYREAYNCTTHPLLVGRPVSRGERGTVREMTVRRFLKCHL